MNEILDFVGSYWWLVFPLTGVAAMWSGSWSEAAERRHRRKMELYRLKHPEHAREPLPAPPREHSRARDVHQVLRSHDDVDRRWLTYELDAAKLIDFPAMTDVRDPLTVAFLRAKREADSLRPEETSSVSSEELSAYRSAVTSYDVAFQVAETEARRVRLGGFSPEERQRLEKARKLVTIVIDDAATAAERQVAYRRARRELDGLIVLPDATVASLEEKVAGALDPRSGSTSS